VDWLETCRIDAVSHKMWPIGSSLLYTLNTSSQYKLLIRA